jgi:hypothetical protein
MWAGDWFRFGAAIAFEFGPDSGEGEQGAIFVQTEPNNILLARRRVRLRCVFGKAIGWDKAAVFRFEPTLSVQRVGVANIGDGKAASAWRWRQAPAHHHQFALGARITDHGCWIIRKHAGHRR